MFDRVFQEAEWMTEDVVINICDFYIAKWLDTKQEDVMKQWVGIQHTSTLVLQVN